MKKIIVMLIAVMTAVVLCACGGEKQITGDAGQGGQTAGKAAGGYLFETKGTKVEIDSEMSKIEDALGEPISYFESESCAIGDLDKVYTYSGFRIDTYQFDGIDYISDVIFTFNVVPNSSPVTKSLTPS